MKKTVFYLPDGLDSKLERMASHRGRSKSELVIEAVREFVQKPEHPKPERPRPRLPLFSSGDPTWAERVDEELRGFGE